MTERPIRGALPVYRRIYYGWWVLAAAAGLGFLGFGALIPGFLVFATPIKGELGISSAQFAFVVGAAWAVGNVASLGAGWLADRYGGRMLVLAGGLLCCVGFAAVAGVNEYWQLLLVYSGVAAVGRGIGVAPNLMTVVNQWFVRRKALTMTLLNTAFAGGAAIMVSALAYLETHFGWRTVILWTGGFVAVLTGLATVVIRSRPEDMGLLPDGERPAAGRMSEGRGRRIEPTYSESDFTLRQAVATPVFWLMTAAVTLRIAAADALVINQIPDAGVEGDPGGTGGLLSVGDVPGDHPAEIRDGVGGDGSAIALAAVRRDDHWSGRLRSFPTLDRVSGGGDVRGVDSGDGGGRDAGLAGGWRVFRAAEFRVAGGDYDGMFWGRVAGSAGGGGMDFRQDRGVRDRVGGSGGDATGVGGVLPGGAAACGVILPGYTGCTG